jgi:hypothetical protein
LENKLETKTPNLEAAATKDIAAKTKRIKDPAKKTSATAFGLWPMPNLIK